jgi:hypothetical protein
MPHEQMTNQCWVVTKWSLSSCSTEGRLAVVALRARSEAPPREAAGEGDQLTLTGEGWRSMAARYFSPR